MHHEVLFPNILPPPTCDAVFDHTNIIATLLEGEHRDSFSAGRAVMVHWRIVKLTQKFCFLVHSYCWWDSNSCCWQIFFLFLVATPSLSAVDVLILLTPSIHLFSRFPKVFATPTAMIIERLYLDYLPMEDQLSRMCTMPIP
jgi:hypothetical protein